jgi:hypothetical protein
MHEQIRCARCHRKLKNCHWVGVRPYGSVCIKKIVSTTQAVLFRDAAI